MPLTLYPLPNSTKTLSRLRCYVLRGRFARVCEGTRILKRKRRSSAECAKETPTTNEMNRKHRRLEKTNFGMTAKRSAVFRGCSEQCLDRLATGHADMD